MVGTTCVREAGPGAPREWRALRSPSARSPSRARSAISMFARNLRGSYLVGTAPAEPVYFFDL